MVTDGVEILIVDLHFREQFAMTLPTKRYNAALCITEHFVGGADRLRAMVNFLCAEMAVAVAIRGLTLPPWRRRLAVLSKWLPTRAHAMRVLPGGPQAASSAASTAASGVQLPSAAFTAVPYSHAARPAGSLQRDQSAQPSESAQPQAQTAAQRTCPEMLPVLASLDFFQARGSQVSAAAAPSPTRRQSQTRVDRRASLLSLGLGLQRSKSKHCNVCDLWQRLSGEQTRMVFPPIRTVKLCGAF